MRRVVDPHGSHNVISRNRSFIGGVRKGLSVVSSPCDPLTVALNELDRHCTHIDNAAYASLIRWSGNQKSLLYGRQIHAKISASRREGNTFLANLLIEMYGKCRSVQDAWNVFNKLSRRDLFSWNSMIAAYAHNEHEVEALQLYRQMQMEGVKPNKFTFFPVLSASASLRALGEGRQIHKQIVACGFESDIAVRTALLHMYGKCGSLKHCRAIFDAMLVRDAVSWNAMIGAYAQNGCGKEALELFTQMDTEGAKPDRITFLGTLEACASLASLENGRAIHKCIVACGLESNVIIKTALINMYGKCGSLKDARRIFDRLHERDAIFWNAMIAAYGQNGNGHEALELFRKMDSTGIKPDRITFLSILDACARLESIENGRAIHKRIVASDFKSDIAVASALVTMYGKCGVLEEAHKVFNEMHERDVILWTAIIAAYAQNGHGKEALELFRQMDLGGIKPDRITFLSVLDACANLASLEYGREIHGQIVACGFDSDVAIRNALVNMYGKCGALKDAHRVFDEMQERDMFSWNAMIAIYAQNGYGKVAFELFREMELDGIKPDMITFLSIINACGHTGLLDVGWRCFVSMIGDYGITPSQEHYVSMSDILGRLGSLDEAEDLIINMPIQPSAVVWSMLLGACRIHGDVKRAAHISEHVFELNLKDASPYILLSNIYVAAGRWDDAATIRKTIERLG